MGNIQGDIQTMKATLFCIICLMIAFVINANADKQMQQDTPKIVQQSYTM